MKLKYIGTITGFRGYKGDLLLKDVLKSTPKIPKSTLVNIGFSVNFTQRFELLKWDRKHDLAIINLVGVNNENEASKFLERGLFIDEDVLNNIDSNYLSTGLLNGYRVEDTHGVLIGIAIEVIEMPSSDILYVKVENGALPIPVVDEIVLKIDKRKKLIIVNLIDGLMDLVVKDVRK